MIINVSDIEYINDLDEEYHQDMEVIIRDLELDVPNELRGDDSALELFVTENILDETGFIPNGFMLTIMES